MTSLTQTRYGSRSRRQGSSRWWRSNQDSSLRRSPACDGRGTGADGGRLGHRLGGGGHLQADGEFERAGLEPVAVLDLDLTFHRLVVHEGAVGAAEVLNEDLAAADQDGTVTLADRGTGR